VFFGLAGLGTDLSVFKTPSLVGLMLAVIAIASLGKFVGAFIGGRLGGLTFRESLALGCGMNARGSTEVIIATIGLSMGVLSQSLYTVIVAMAVITTMAMPPTLRWALARLPLGAEEKKRLEREEFEARGFVTNMERLLIAADASANGKFASRLAGLIAGTNGMPTTLVPVQTPDGSQATATKEPAGRAQAIRAAAQAARTADTDGAGSTAVKVDIVKPTVDASIEEIIADEVPKGYDMLVIGVERPATKGVFAESVNRIAARFEGPLAIVEARGPHREDAMKSRLNILVPMTGTEVSLQATEVGIAIARATKAPITALYVSAGKSSPRMAPRLRNAVQPREHAEAILREAVEMADRYGIEMRTAVKTDAAVADAILRHAGASRHTLIVMGVNRRPGETLYFGDVPSAILEQSPRSILFVSSPRAFGTPQESNAGNGRGAPASSSPPKPAQSRSDRSRQPT